MGGSTYPILLPPRAGHDINQPSCCTLGLPQVQVFRAKERTSGRAVVVKFSLRCGRGVGLASSCVMCKDGKLETN